MASSSIIVGQNLNTGFYQRQSQRPLYWNPISVLGFSNCRNQIRLWSNKSRLAFELSNSKRKSLVVYANMIPGAPMPSVPPPSGSGYMSWVLGIAVSIILPFVSRKWGPPWVLKNRIGNAVQMVENVAEAVEKVAGQVDKIAEHIADDLPEGQFKNLVRMVEHTAEKVAVAADALDNIIDNVQEAEEQVECVVESMAIAGSKGIENANNIKDAVQIVENVADEVEKEAGKVDIIAEHIADDLPEGQLKDMFRMVEHTAEKTAMAADALDNVIDKVQEAEEQVECLVEIIQENAQEISKL